jgi:hypothetical protein
MKTKTIYVFFTKVSKISFFIGGIWDFANKNIYQRTEALTAITATGMELKTTSLKFPAKQVLVFCAFCNPSLVFIN